MTDNSDFYDELLRIVREKFGDTDVQFVHEDEGEMHNSPSFRSPDGQYGERYWQNLRAAEGYPAGFPFSHDYDPRKVLNEQSIGRKVIAKNHKGEKAGILTRVFDTHKTLSGTYKPTGTFHYGLQTGKAIYVTDTTTDRVRFSN